MKKLIVENKLQILSIIVILSLMSVTLYSMDRLPICECGYIKLWHNNIWSPENSQHLFDLFSFTHAIHGFIFYFVLWVIGKYIPLSPKAKFLLAVAAESAGEVIENTGFVINRYREGTVSQDYFGDSIVNSIGDVISMSFGYYFSYKLPTWAIVTLALLIELLMLYAIRDNFSLNVLMLFYPIEEIRKWQEKVKSR